MRPSITSFSNELLYTIISYLPLPTLLAFRRVCQHWSLLVANAGHYIHPRRQRLLKLWDEAVLTPRATNLHTGGDEGGVYRQLTPQRLLNLLTVSRRWWPNEFLWWAREWPWSNDGLRWLGLPVKFFTWMVSDPDYILVYVHGGAFKSGYITAAQWPFVRYTRTVWTPRMTWMIMLEDIVKEWKEPKVRMGRVPASKRRKQDLPDMRVLSLRKRFKW